MSNNDIIPGLDDEKPRIDASWIVPDQIKWNPLSVRLEKIEGYQDVVIVRLEGELEAFNGSNLAGKLQHGIVNGIRCIYIDLEMVRLGDYREVLVLAIQKELFKNGGMLLLKNPPASLIEYWKFTVPWIFELENLHIINSDESAIKLINEYKARDKKNHA